MREEETRYLEIEKLDTKENTYPLVGWELITLYHDPIRAVANM